MKYAVLQTGGKQYKVSEGSVIEVDKIDSAPNAPIKFENVLMTADDGAYQLGRPNVNGAFITATVIQQKKGEKIRVSKFKAKARYRKTTGHRQLLTTIKIEKINLGLKSEVKPTKREDQKNKTTKKSSGK